MKSTSFVWLFLFILIEAEGQEVFDCDPVKIQKLDSVVNSVREGLTDIYTPVDLFIYDYDGVDIALVVDRISLPGRTPVNRQNYYNDDQNIRSHYILQEWNGAGFTDRSRTDYYYRPDGSAREVFSGFDGTAWLPYQQHIYNYDDDNIIRTYLRQMMYSPDVWTDFSYKNYIYDGQGRLIERNEQRIADGVVFWVELFTYDDRDRVATRVRQTLKYYPATRTSELVNLSRQIYSYDIYGELSGYQTQGWVDNAWILTGRSVYYRSLLEGIMVPVCFNGTTRLLPVKQVAKFLSRGGLLGSCECLFPEGQSGEAKSGAAKSGNRETATEIVVYPNPASSSINVSLPASEKNYSDISIYSLSGSLMRRTISEEGLVSIDISELRPGSYYLVVTGEEGPIMTSFVKKQ